MSTKKMFWLALVSPVIGLYRAFVLQNMWGWFVVSAFHVQEISYWVAYGLILLQWFLFDDAGEESVNGHRWRVLSIVTDACIPDEKKIVVDGLLKQHMSAMWIDLVGSMFGNLAANTVTLAIGWGIHAFLV
jgi:hypothetical protein